eukprot:gene5837-4162_t
MSSNSASVAAQAELMEKEKAVYEHQQRVDAIQSTIKTMSNRQVALNISRRRCDITISELTRLKPDHVVYHGLGRAFVKSGVNKMIESNQESREKSEAEHLRLANEKQRAGESLLREEKDLRQAVEELRAAYQVMAAIQQPGGRPNNS